MFARKRILSVLFIFSTLQYLVHGRVYFTDNVAVRNVEKRQYPLPRAVPTRNDGSVLVGDILYTKKQYYKLTHVKCGGCKMKGHHLRDVPCVKSDMNSKNPFWCCKPFVLVGDICKRQT